MKSIFTYIDYRIFLKDYYNEKKVNTTFFSYRYFANKAGISSPNFLKMVIDGKKNLSEKSIVKFSNALLLDDKEMRFFRNLVLFNQSTSANQKQEYYAILLNMMNSVKIKHISIDQHSIYTHWYTPVIRELICLHDFKDDYKKIADRIFPTIQVQNVEKSINLLLELGLIKRNKDGIYTQVDDAIHSDNDMARDTIRAYNRKMIDLAGDSIYQLSPEERNVSGMTVGISKPSYDMIIAELQACKDRIVSIVNRDENSNDVYQINFQVFPLSKDPENPERGKSEV